MTSQHQQDNSDGQRGDGKARQTAGKHEASLGIGTNSPQGCAMQRLTGYQEKPVVSVKHAQRADAA